MRKKVILDCDPGMDDSMAIVMAAKSPALDLLAVTTTHGNYPVDVTSVNALKVLEMLGREEIPVARGMARPMVRTNPVDPFTHGADGQAENNLPAPAKKLDDRHAVELIVELVKEHWGEIEILTTGPMSNLAMAITQHPEIIEGIKSVTAISGAFGVTEAGFANATGDNPMSEWNVYVDPEAAEIVYNSGIPLHVIGLDVATYFDVDFTDEHLARLEESELREAAFLRKAISFVRGRGYGAYTTVIDCMAVAAVADPNLIESFEGRVGIETQGALTVGMTVLDSRRHHAWDSLPLIRIAKSADYPRFLESLIATVVAEEGK